MKTLKPKVKDPMWVAECNQCKAIMEAKQSELTGITQGTYRNNNESFSWENCPECGKEKSLCFYTADSASGRRTLMALMM